MNNAQIKLDEVMAKMIEKIENAEGKWIKPFNNSMPANFANKNIYSGINILNLWVTAEEKNYSTNNWLTFNQVRKLKAKVNKGEKSTPIFFFKPIKIKDENEEEQTIPMLKMYYVFNLDQTNIKLDDVNNTIEDLEAFVSNTNIEIKRSISGAHYSPKNDFIGIPVISSFKDSESYYAVLFHELAHSTGHSTRLNRDLDTGVKNGNEEEVKAYAKEELIAETTRVFLQAHFNLDTTDMEEQNAIYLKGWLKKLKENPKMLWSIFSQASKAFNYLLENSINKEVAA